jgi:CCR4-NOT transcription complex subunit 1
MANTKCKVLHIVLENSHFDFTIDLAALASRREYINWEKWLADSANAHGDAFLRGLVEFVHQKINLLQRADGVESISAVQFTEDVATACSKVLQSSASCVLLLIVVDFRSMSQECAVAYREIQQALLRAYPQLNSGSGESTVPEVTFAPEVEEAANAYYERIYSGDLTINQVVELLARLKLSPNQREQDVYTCMVHNLFDEYRFFPKYVCSSSCSHLGIRTRN